MSAATFNLAALAEAWLERTGDHESLVFEGRTWRSGDLARRARRSGAGLTRLGVRPGERVVVLMANCPEVSITYNAVWRAGAVVTPVVFLVTPAELHHILVDAEAVAIVTSAELLSTVSLAADDVPSLRHVIVVEPGQEVDLPAGIDVVPFTHLEDADEAPIVPRDDDDLAALMYTGGTTGRAKGVMLSHRNMWFSGKMGYDASYSADETLTRTLVPLPLSHAYGMLVTVLGWHVEDPGLVVLQRWFDPAGWLALVGEHRVQRSPLVPTMLQMLLGQRVEDADLSSLRYVSSGAAPLARETIEEWERRVPGCEVLEGYGCTETAALVSTNPPGRRRVGSVGLPVPGVDVRISDDGEICVRSAGIMQGYWHAPGETAEALRDGWLHTGDIGHVDDDGYLYVVDRKKDLIIRGGFNVFPRDVEDALVEHPAVAMAGVVGRRDDRLGEEVVAFVALRPGATADSEELVAFARDRLAKNKYPREVHIVDAIPLTSVGKLDRKALRARL